MNHWETWLHDVTRLRHAVWLSAQQLFCIWTVEWWVEDGYSCRALQYGHAPTSSEQRDTTIINHQVTYHGRTLPSHTLPSPQIRSDELIQWSKNLQELFRGDFPLGDPIWSSLIIYIYIDNIYIWSKMIQVYIINAFVDNVHLLIVPSVLQN